MINYYLGVREEHDSRKRRLTSSNGNLKKRMESTDSMKEVEEEPVRGKTIVPISPGAFLHRKKSLLTADVPMHKNPIAEASDEAGSERRPFEE